MMLTRPDLMFLNCVRCGHKWMRRTIERPMTCAKCRSPYWDKPRKRKKAALKVGDVVTIGNDPTQHVIKSVYAHRDTKGRR